MCKHYQATTKTSDTTNYDDGAKSAAEDAAFLDAMRGGPTIRRIARDRDWWRRMSYAMSIIAAGAAIACIIIAATS